MCEGVFAGGSGYLRRVSGVELVHDLGRYLDGFAHQELGHERGEIVVGVRDMVDDHPDRARVSVGEGARAPLFIGASTDEVDQPLTGGGDLSDQIDGVGHDVTWPSPTMPMAPR
jgi:hypothetical protein